MLGVFFADGEQHFDHRTLQDHVAPNCTSDLLYKGALRDRSRAVYSGWVHVRPDAQKTNAMQTSRNIVLSEHAKADAIPNLEIEANDVRCGHAASVGPVDEETIFYLQSRGITREDAERLIVSGFFQEVLDRVQIDEVREGAEAAIASELAGRRARMTLVKVCAVADVPGGRGPPLRGRRPPVRRREPRATTGSASWTRSARTRTTSWTRARSTSTTRRSSARSTVPRST